MGDVTVRPLTRNDCGAVRAMLANSGVFSDVEVRIALEMVDAGLVGEYSLLAAVQNGRTCGYACFGLAPLTDSSWYLYWICIARDAQGRGVGQSLQSAVENVVRGMSGCRLVLETSSRGDYEPARRFYRRAGFAEVGCIPNFYKSGDDCLIYCKVLSGEEADERPRSKYGVGVFHR